jgi:hypothetical protein
MTAASIRNTLRSRSEAAESEGSGKIERLIECRRGDLNAAAARRSGRIRRGHGATFQRIGQRLSHRDRS